MPVDESLSILAVPGRGQDERVWGDLLSRLRRHHEVVAADDAGGLETFTGDAVLASSDAASAAVHAAWNGTGRALVLLAPISRDVPPEADLDLGPRVDEGFKLMEVITEVTAIEDRERRRSVLADGMVRLLGRDIPAADLARLRAMIYDSADLILDPRWTRMSRPAPYADELAALRVPTLILAAGRDRYAAALGRSLAGRAPKGELVLLDTAQIYYPWLARPDATADAVFRFLGKV